MNQQHTEGKVAAYPGFPPEPQEMPAKQIGHVVVNSTSDRPWSQYFCRMGIRLRGEQQAPCEFTKGNHTDPLGHHDPQCHLLPLLPSRGLIHIGVLALHVDAGLLHRR